MSTKSCNIGRKEKAAIEYALAHKGCPKSITKAFIAGSEWRINSVWHDAKERPKDLKQALVEYHNGKEVRYMIDTHIKSGWLMVFDYGTLLRYAYIDDILPVGE